MENANVMISEKQVEGVCEALLRIAHGDHMTSGGLEGITMALCGPGGPGHMANVSDSLRDSGGEIAGGLDSISEAIDQHTTAINNLADAIKCCKCQNT